jgi:hypothetical protein
MLFWLSTILTVGSGHFSVYVIQNQFESFTAVGQSVMNQEEERMMEIPKSVVL